jgi:hypothetical protein
LEDEQNGSGSLQSHDRVDLDPHPSSEGEGMTEIKEIVEALKDLTSLHQGEERLGRVQHLSGSQFLGLLDDCRTRLAQLGLTPGQHRSIKHSYGPRI